MNGIDYRWAHLHIASLSLCLEAPLIDVVCVRIWHDRHTVYLFPLFTNYEANSHMFRNNQKEKTQRMLNIFLHVATLVSWFFRCSEFDSDEFISTGISLFWYDCAWRRNRAGDAKQNKRQSVWIHLLFVQVLQVDEIKFDQPVYIDEIRIIPSGYNVTDLQNSAARIGYGVSKKFLLACLIFFFQINKADAMWIGIFREKSQCTIESWSSEIPTIRKVRQSDFCSLFLISTLNIWLNLGDYFEMKMTWYIIQDIL